MLQIVPSGALLAWMASMAIAGYQGDETPRNETVKRNSLTLLRVVREGLASGLLAMIHSSLVRMDALSIALSVPAVVVCKFKDPSSSKKSCNAVKTTPTLRSFPDSHATQIRFPAINPFWINPTDCGKTTCRKRDAPLFPEMTGI
jgi:hypothetical protein